AMLCPGDVIALAFVEPTETGTLVSSGHKLTLFSSRKTRHALVAQRCSRCARQQSNRRQNCRSPNTSASHERLCRPVQCRQSKPKLLNRPSIRFWIKTLSPL